MRVFEAENPEEEKFLKHRQTFFKKTVKQNTIGKIYPYGMKSVMADAKEFIGSGSHKIKPCSRDFQPNPYFYQYDLETHLFLEYENIVKKELDLVDSLLSKAPKSEWDDLEQHLDMVAKFGTGIPRQEHFWNAVSIRWPERDVNGARISPFVREPWGEDFIDGMCDYNYVIAFGGSGQGKTHRALAFMCICWDHYIDTQKGGRALISTVNEDKLKQSTWPYLQMIYKESKGSVYSEDEDPISLYAGRGKISGEFTIRRPNDLKGGGHIKGMLIAKANNGSAAVDKITGAHGHPFGMYHIDEMQSTPIAPVKASPNFRQNCRHSWITGSGNYDLETDALGLNTVPIGGWKSVDENTHIYESQNILGIRTLCIHYNNDLSPAMGRVGEKKWGHILPTKEKKENSYPTKASQRTDEHRRLWIGWKKKSDIDDSVLSTIMIKANGCDGNTFFDPRFPVTHGWSLDSATGSIDRNITTHFADGVCKNTGIWKCHIFEARANEKIEDPMTYVRSMGQQLLQYSSEWGVKSGFAVMDWTNQTGIPEYLLERGFRVQTMSYGEAVPDGKAKNRFGIKEKEIIVDADRNIKGHMVAADIITCGAYIMQQFVNHGQITGLCDALITPDNSEHTFEEEICKRSFQKEPHRTYGDRYKLEPKSTRGKKTHDRGIKGFKELYGFSPDILDTIFQIGYYLVKYRGMVPGKRKMPLKNFKPPVEIDRPFEETPMYSSAQMWEDDLIGDGMESYNEDLIETW